MVQRHLDLDILRSLLAIAETGSFTRAAQQLNRTQSTLSLQIKRLETLLGARLLERSAHQLRLTPAGLDLLEDARALLRMNDAAVARFFAPVLEGLVRLGTPEDFATMHLPHVLAAFAEHHPRVALEVTTDLTLNLLERFHAREFDIVLVKREPLEAAQPHSTLAGGRHVWREPLVWAGHKILREQHIDVLPLIVSPAPCVYRKRALTSLEAAGWRWRIAYTSTSLAGTQAAVQARLGVTVLPRAMLPSGICVLGPSQGLPPLADTQIALLGNPSGLSAPASRLADHIIASLEKAV
jgi:DNA-binding transcriptional LysR family regulator